MAKLTANKSHALREFHVTLPEGYEQAPGYVLESTVRAFYVLRSDGKVLRAVSSPDAATAYDRKRSGYTIHGTLKNRSNRDEMLASFDRYRNKLAAKHEANGEGVVVSPVVVK